jgi:lysozyme family protein
MVASTYDEAMARVFAHEGGLSTVRSDPGNWTGGKVGVGTLKGTNYGISAKSYPALDIRNLTRDEAAAIYRRDYAAKVAYEAQPAGVDYTLLDVAINSGPGRALAFARQVLGSDATAAKALAQLATLRGAPVDLIKALARIRTGFYRGLSAFAAFGTGWLRRTAEVEAASIALALKFAGAPAAQVRKELSAEGGTAGKTAAAQRKAAGGAATTTAGSGAGATQVAGGWGWGEWALIAALVVGGIALTIWLMHRTRVNRARAEAFARVGAEIMPAAPAGMLRTSDIKRIDPATGIVEDEET